MYYPLKYSIESIGGTIFFIYYFYYEVYISIDRYIYYSFGSTSNKGYGVSECTVILTGIQECAWLTNYVNNAWTQQ